MGRNEAIGSTSVTIDIMEHVLNVGIVRRTRTFDKGFDDTRRNLVGKHDDESCAKHKPEEGLDHFCFIRLGSKEQLDQDNQIDTYPDEFAAESVPEHISPSSAIIVQVQHQRIVV